MYSIAWFSNNVCIEFGGLKKNDVEISDRPILIFYNRYRYRYLYIYVTDNRYSEPIFIYCYKVNK